MTTAEEERPVEKSHHSQIKEITDRISEAVGVLYKEKRAGETKKRQHQEKDKLKDAKAGKAPIPAPSVGPRQKRQIVPDKPDESGDEGGSAEEEANKELEAGSNSGSEASRLELDRVQLGDLDEEWDMDVSKQHVKALLESLKTEKRTDVVGKLSSWFENKARSVTDDVDQLTALEKTRSKQEHELDQAHETVEQDLAEKEMQSLQVLNKFYKVLHGMGKRGQEHTKQMQQARRSLKPGIAGAAPGTDKNVEIDATVTDLRARLEQGSVTVAAGGKAVQSEGDAPKVSDLLQVITAQQDEIATLSAQADMREKRVKHLKTALEYVQGGMQGQVDREIAEVVEEIKTRVRETKIAEMIAKREQETNETLKPPDESEVQALEQECADLRKQAKEIDDEIKEIKSPGAREHEAYQQQQRLEAARLVGPAEEAAVIAEMEEVMQDIAPSQAPGLKAKLTVELNRVQQENEKLQASLKESDQLIQSADATLRTMEEQKTIFLESVAVAKQNVLGDIMPTEEEMATADIPAAGEEEEVDNEELMRQQRVLDALKQDEAQLKMEIEELEKLFQGAHERVKEEKEMQKELRRSSTTDSAEGELPETQVAEELGVGDPLPKLIEKMQEIHKKLSDEDRKLAVEAERKKLKEEPPGPPAVENIVSAEMMAERALEQGVKFDVDEFLKIQQENSDLSNEIEMLTEKLGSCLKTTSKGQPMGLAALTEEDVATDGVPQENVDLRKEVRRKQKELTALRMKWWAARQDPKNVARRAWVDSAPEGRQADTAVEKSRESAGTEVSLASNRRSSQRSVLDTPFGQFEKILARLDTTATKQGGPKDT